MATTSDVYSEADIPIIAMPQHLDEFHIVRKRAIPGSKTITLLIVYWLRVPALKCTIPIICGDKGDIIKPNM